MDALQNILNKFPLTSHPEGGAFLETYRSTSSGEFESFDGPRSVSTGIYFLLKENEFSSLHKIKSDEMWHFYLGGPLKITEITPDGKLIETVLGQDISQGENLQYVVPAGHWFGASPLKGSGFSFVGCTVAPGFDFRDFELARRDDLLKMYPKLDKIITNLTR